MATAVTAAAARNMDEYPYATDRYPVRVGAIIAARLATKCIVPLIAPTRAGGTESITTVQYTTFGSELKALASVINAITAAALCARETSTRQVVVINREVAAKTPRAMTRLPVLRSSQSEIRPPSNMVMHAPTQGIMPTYQSDDRLK